MGEAADLAVGFRRLLEVEVGEGMRLDRARLDLEGLEQVLADQVRRLAARAADAEVDVRLAEINGLQLGMAVGEMQQRDVAEARQFIQLVPALGSKQFAAVEGESRGGSGSEDLQELSAVHGHVGASSKKAWRSQAFSGWVVVIPC
ncbi:MAG: hypothetical protein M5R42_08335 [Rhodocyclaceae bacterium]|nr:hypothetical protein [Rhodocyclaceae bacterium]